MKTKKNLLGFLFLLLTGTCCQLNAMNSRTEDDKNKQEILKMLDHFEQLERQEEEQQKAQEKENLKTCRGRIEAVMRRMRKRPIRVKQNY